MTRRCSFLWLLPTAHSLLLVGCGVGATKPAAKPIDTELAQQLSAGRAAFSHGAWGQAASLYALALKRAESMDDASAIAGAAYNHGAALVQLGRYDDARDTLAEARAEARTAGEPAADIAILQARVARLQNHPDDALALADEVLADRTAMPEARLQAVLVKGQLAAERNDAAASRDALARTKPLIQNGTTPFLASGIAELEGRIALLDDNPAAAAERFDREAAFLRQAHLYQDMSRALARAAEAYRAANQPALAADRYYRAARSALAQNDPAAARPWLGEAAQLSANGDPVVTARIARLRKSFPATQPSTK